MASIDGCHERERGRPAAHIGYYSARDGGAAIGHFAGPSNDPFDNLHPELTCEIRLLATVRFARLEDFEGPRYNRANQVRMLLAEGELDATLRRR